MAFTFEERSIDYSALIMPVSLLIISYGILKYDFLGIRTMARETIFENNFVGMVVLGPGHDIPKQTILFICNKSKKKAN
jgi:hypothetical protein